MALENLGWPLGHYCFCDSVNNISCCLACTIILPLTLQQYCVSVLVSLFGIWKAKGSLLYLTDQQISISIRAISVCKLYTFYSSIHPGIQLWYLSWFSHDWVLYLQFKMNDFAFVYYLVGNYISTLPSLIEAMRE